MAIIGKGYSIWIEPTGNIKMQLDQIIKDLSEKYQTPLFISHVTLLGNIQGDEDTIKQSMIRLSQDILPYQIELTEEVIMEEHWTKTVAIRTRKTPAVLGANTKAKKIFEIPEFPKYEPHLSLIYSENLPLSEKQAIVKDLAADIFKIKFPVNSIQLYNTAGPVENWHLITSYSLVK